MWKESGGTVDRAVLQLGALLFASILLPSLVAVNFHAECFGRWTSFWEPCRRKNGSDFARASIQAGDLSRKHGADGIASELKADSLLLHFDNISPAQGEAPEHRQDDAAGCERVAQLCL
eukprot:4222582-Amphidinium_carterae.1